MGRIGGNVDHSITSTITCVVFASNRGWGTRYPRRKLSSVAVVLIRHILPGMVLCGALSAARAGEMKSRICDDRSRTLSPDRHETGECEEDQE